MTQEFVPFELAVKLKALRFDELCFTFFTAKGLMYMSLDFNGVNSYRLYDNECLAPTYSQALRWFREEQDIEGFVHKSIEGNYYFVIKRTGNNESNIYEFMKTTPKNFDTYEEAELACLTKLIEIVENK